MITHIIFIIIGIVGCIIGLKVESLICFVLNVFCIIGNGLVLYQDITGKPENKVEHIQAKTVQVDTLINIQNGVRDTTYVITKIN